MGTQEGIIYNLGLGEEGEIYPAGSLGMWGEEEKIGGY